jgi:uncharacterized protein YwqG
MPAMSQWPVDAEGKPMAMVAVQLSELVGLPEYSNVTIGPVAVWRFVEDDEETIKGSIDDTGVLVEQAVGEYRKTVREYRDKLIKGE